MLRLFTLWRNPSWNFALLAVLVLKFPPSVWDAWVCRIFMADAMTTNRSLPSIALLELGITFLDTADAYGPYKNEELVGKAIKGKRDQVVIATKFGIVRDPEDPHVRGINGKPDYVRNLSKAALSDWESRPSTSITSTA